MKISTHFFILTRSFLFRLRNVAEKVCSDNQNRHFVLGTFFPSKIVQFERKYGKIF